MGQVLSDVLVVLVGGALLAVVAYGALTVGLAVSALLSRPRRDPLSTELDAFIAQVLGSRGADGAGKHLPRG
ncbi:MAG: hypothetical protein ACP5VR_03510 [Acidimicrobiales bacterium]